MLVVPHQPGPTRASEAQMKALDLLRNAGWYPGRQVDVVDQVDAAATFLTEFSNLSILGPGNRNPLEVGGPDLALDADSGGATWTQRRGSTLPPLGEYPSLVLFISVDGAFYVALRTSMEI